MTTTILRPAAFLFTLGVMLLSLTVVSTNADRSGGIGASKVPVAQANVSVITWEHRIITAKDPQALADRANQLGSESWELVSVVQVLNDSRYSWAGFLKRPKH
jgi:hypothetical protein